MHVRPEDTRVAFRESPLRRIVAELYCLLLTFVFHPHNDNQRKAATLLVVGVWAAIEIGAAFGTATLPEQFYFLRLVVGIVIGRMWGIEINNFAGLEFDYRAAGDGGADEDADEDADGDSSDE